jgi:hypothetical protein
MAEELNVYNLSRNWFDWCFENPEKISPNHAAMYFFIIEHCNRLGWKDKFGLPTSMVKDAIGIKNFRTYTNTLNDLVEWNFIRMIERSKNQYSSNIVAIVKNTRSTTKALDKALQKHSQKQSKSIVSIDKQDTTIQLYNSTIVGESEFYPFNEFWDDYAKKIGDKDKLESKWNKIGIEDRKKIKEYIPLYISSQPEKKFRKNPETFLNNKSWNDEIIESDNKQKQHGGQSNIASLKERAAARAGIFPV